VSLFFFHRVRGLGVGGVFPERGDKGKGKANRALIGIHDRLQRLLQSDYECYDTHDINLLYYAPPRTRWSLSYYAFV